MSYCYNWPDCRGTLIRSLIYSWLKWNKLRASTDRPPPFLERNLKKQTTPAGVNQSVIISAGQARGAPATCRAPGWEPSIVLTRPGRSSERTFHSCQDCQFLVLNVRRSLYCWVGGVTPTQSLENKAFSVISDVEMSVLIFSPGDLWVVTLTRQDTRSHWVSTKLSLVYLPVSQPYKPDS